MPSYDELIHISAAVEAQKLAGEKIEKKSFLDYFSLAVTTDQIIAPGKRLIEC